jgi:uncharacterized protein YneR
VSVRKVLFSFALAVTLPAIAHAQDFGIVESAETINVGNFKLRGNPMILFGKNGGDAEVGAAFAAGYGFTPRFDMEGQAAFYDGVTMFGANAEYWVLKENPFDFSIAGGLHRRTGNKTADLTGVDLTFLASGHVAKRLEVYGGIDMAFEGVGQPGGYKTVHFVPGIEHKINDSLDLDAEVGIALNDAARNYAAIALAFYIR